MSIGLHSLQVSFVDTTGSIDAGVIDPQGNNYYTFCMRRLCFDPGSCHGERLAQLLGKANQNGADTCILWCSCLLKVCVFLPYSFWSKFESDGRILHSLLSLVNLRVRDENHVHSFVLVLRAYLWAGILFSHCKEAASLIDSKRMLC